jgi:hypothetical protein
VEPEYVEPVNVEPVNVEPVYLPDLKQDFSTLFVLS